MDYAEVLEKWSELLDIGSFGHLRGSSEHPRKTAQGQNQDQVLRDSTLVPFQGVDDDEDQDVGDQSHEEEDEAPIQRQQLLPHPRVHQSIQRDHPVDNILGSIRRGVTTCPSLAFFL